MIAFPKYVTPAHCEAIGRIVVAWAVLETSMLIALQALLGMDRSKAIIAFWHTSYNERRDRILTLADFTTKNKRIHARLKRLRKRMDEAYAIRNIVAHSRWDKSQNRRAITPFIIKARGELKISGVEIEEKHWTPADLKREARKTLRLATDFRSFFAANFGARFDRLPED